MAIPTSEATLLLKKYMGAAVVAMLYPKEPIAAARMARTLKSLQQDGHTILVVVDENENGISFCLTGCVFGYSEPRELSPGWQKKWAEQRFAGSLEITDPVSGMTLGIFEPKA